MGRVEESFAIESGLPKVDKTREVCYIEYGVCNEGLVLKVFERVGKEVAREVVVVFVEFFFQ